jgi:hypothetical protein
MTMKKGKLIVATLALLTVTACGGGAGEESHAPDGATVAGSGVSGSTSTGVAECDRIYNEIEKCIADNVPAGQKEAMASAFKESKEQIAKLAVGKEAAIAKSCEAQRAQLKQQYCPQ